MGNSFPGSNKQDRHSLVYQSSRELKQASREVMDRYAGRVALVTGASSGIGANVAECLVKHGMVVVGCCRNIKPIQEMAERLKGGKGSLHAIQCDVTKEDQIISMFSRIKKDHGGVDVCINNAGVAQDAPLLTGNADKWRNMFEVNVLGPSVCTREAIKCMKDRKVDDGQIIHVGSVMGHSPPQMAALHFYAASKAALSSITEGHRNELKEAGSNIKVTVLSLGLVETPLISGLLGEQAAKDVFNSMKLLQPSDISASILYVMSSQHYVEAHDIVLRSRQQKIL